MFLRVDDKFASVCPKKLKNNFSINSFSLHQSTGINFFYNAMTCLKNLEILKWII